MRTAGYEDVLDAIREGRLRVDPSTGRIEGRRLDPKAKWRPKALEIVRAPHSRRQGYARITFATKNGRFRCLAHRVIWFAARGSIPASLEMNHRNTNKMDNRIANLELVTSGENNAHAIAHGLYDPYAPKNWSLSSRQVRAIRRRVDSGESQRAVARALGITPNVVNRIARGRTYRSVE